MKKLLVLSIAVAAFSGCGRGWLPLYQGAPCNTCAPAPQAACNDCGVTSGYAPYESDYINEYNLGPVYAGESMVPVPSN